MAAATRPPDAPWSVAELARRIDATLRQGFPTAIRVAGEISGFRDRTHWYFDLKDETCVVNCAIFASSAKRVPFTPRDGLHVIVTGRLEFYAKGGKVTLLVDAIEPVGAGALDLAFRALCDKLRALGWFALERKRRLPTFPRRVGVVTSRTGAALQDVLVTMRKRCPAVEVMTADVRVQGDKAAAEITSAIRWLSKHAARLGIDAILVTRGGGSAEDLWCFNDREVARAIVECSIPVVAAIGHETDTTIAELVADERCATPTQAAMRLTPDNAALERQVASTHRRLLGQVQRHVRDEQSRLARLARHPALSDPARLVGRARTRCDELANALRKGVNAVVSDHAGEFDILSTLHERQRPALVVERAQVRLAETLRRLNVVMNLTLGRSGERAEALARHLDAVAPTRVLERGYSVTTDLRGRLIRSVEQAAPGGTLLTRLADGTLRSVVQGPRPPGSAGGKADAPGGLFEAVGG